MRLVSTSVLSLSLILATAPALHAATLAPGRVAHLDGELRLDNASDASRTLITENAVVGDGDELSTPPGSYAELELAGATFIRLAGGTAIALDRVDDGWQVVLFDGLVSVYRGVNAPAVSLLAFQSRVALDDDTEVRAELEREALAAEVVIKSGRAELVTASGTELVPAGTTIHQRPGAEERGTWDGRLDAFDRWIVERVQAYVNHPAPPVAGLDYVGLEDLAGAGEWVELDGQPRWRPFVDEEWRPYAAGTWSWVEPWGWVFVPDTAWGYVTHHYGRWLHDEGYGWLWVPDPVFGGAYVAWVVGGPYVGWAPLDPYGRAVVIGAYVDELDALVWIFADLTYFYWGGGWCDWDRTWVYVDQTTINDWDVTVVTHPSDDLHPDCDDERGPPPGKDPGKTPGKTHKPTTLAKRLLELHRELPVADARKAERAGVRANPPRLATRRADDPKARGHVFSKSRFDGPGAAASVATRARSQALPAAGRAPVLPAGSSRDRPTYGGVRTPVAPTQPSASPSPEPTYRPSVPSMQTPPSPSYRPSTPAPSYRPSAPTPSYRPSAPTPAPSYRPSTPAPSYRPSAPSPAPSYRPPPPSQPTPAAAPAKPSPAPARAKAKKGDR